MSVTYESLLEQLEQLKQAVRRGELAVVRVDVVDVDWSSFPAAGCATPGIDVGQDSDLRFPTNTAEGLHVQIRSGVVEAHLDQVDACRAPFGHLVADTNAVPAAIAAAAGGAALCGLLGALVGLVFGGFAGGRVASRSSRVVFTARVE